MLAAGPTAGFGTQDLARSAQGGDPGAFEALVGRFQRRVWGLAYQYVRDLDEAQDLAQEVFFRLYQALHRYDPSRPFEPWFWRLAANVAASYRRRRPAPSLELVEAAAPEPSRESLPLELAVASLDSGLRLPLLLHYHADLPLEDVAAAMGLSMAAVKSRLHRARAVLRRVLVEEVP